MKKMKLIWGVALLGKLAAADCNFTYVNKSTHPVTLQGYFLEDGDGLSDTGWITVEPTRQVVQVRTGKKCSSIYKHSGQLETRINLKNASGYWIGNKGFLFAADRSYSHYRNKDHALADDNAPVVLSNGTKVSVKEMKVFICDAKIDSDDCH